MIILQFKLELESSWRTKCDQLHRLHGKPAWQAWYPNGQKKYESYYEHNSLHRLHGKPAFQHWYQNGQKCSEGYFEHGELIK